MEEQGKQIRLTAAEISQLWTQYMSDTASICMLTYYCEKVEDAEIKPVIEHSLQIATSHIQKITAILTEEKYSIPHGFKVEEDVDLTAPRLFSDSYVLNFIHNMARVGLHGYSLSLSVAVRTDITDYYKECLSETMQLYEMTKNLLLSKGLYIRSPYFPNLEQVDYVNKQGFMLDVFGEKRPLIALEVTHLYTNIQRNAIGVATLYGFSQVARSKDVTQFFIKGIEIGKKHRKLFSEKLEEGNLTAPMTWATETTNSTTYTFSEKLMMFFTASLNTLSIGYYGVAIAESPRIDIGVLYNRLTLEIQKYALEGARIMVKNKWMEQPPIAPDRNELANKYTD
ncbi:DUF3231 family protein [Virgibacillus necropolis]|uniref:Uncharacterized protein n=1 Tax=Virgibacillus necropolis TaxID=163877 RepID=A0A221MEZ0_9BACI|nr:DUF3231 family protein [Virgibacillus necropolis]ASN06182.1 hypothetical protein CFK40_14705 [Virgibacillus necropolis]